MDIVFRTVVQLTVTTKVMAINFEDFMKSLPVPADLKAMILDMNENQQEFSMPDMDDVTLMDFKTATPFTARKPNEMIKPMSTVLAKTVTKWNKPVTPEKRFLRTLVTLNPSPSCLEIVSSTAKAPEKQLTLPPPPFKQLSGMPMQMPMPMAIPIFARVPVMLPMRAYFETVKHDHPPLYKIKRMIEEDENRWKEEKVTDSEISVEVCYSDVSSDKSTDTDNDSHDSEYNDVGSDYSDDGVSNRGGKDR